MSFLDHFRSYFIKTSVNPRAMCDLEYFHTIILINIQNKYNK